MPRQKMPPRPRKKMPPRPRKEKKRTMPGVVEIPKPKPKPKKPETFGHKVGSRPRTEIEKRREIERALLEGM